jgi:hypothetical protein
MFYNKIPWKLIPFIAVYLIAAMLIGATSVVKSQFSWAIFVDHDYWYEVITVFSANTLILVATAIFHIQKQRKENPLVVKKEKEVGENVDECITPDFDEYWAEKNLNRKIKAYKRQLNKRLDKLDRKASQRDFETRFSNDQELIQSNKYCQKRNEVLRRLDDNFINENITHMYVDYKPLSKKFVTNGYDRDYDGGDFVPENPTKKFIEDLLPRTMLSLSYVIIFRAFVPELRDLSWVVLFTIGYKLILLIVNGFTGRTYADTYIKEKVLVDLRQRQEEIEGFLEYKIEQKGASVNER